MAVDVLESNLDGRELEFESTDGSDHVHVASVVGYAEEILVGEVDPCSVVTS